jgi:hypothetical protein
MLVRVEAAGGPKVTDKTLLDALKTLTPAERRAVIAHIKGHRTSQSWRLIRRLRFQLKARARKNKLRP